MIIKMNLVVGVALMLINISFTRADATDDLIQAIKTHNYASCEAQNCPLTVEGITRLTLKDDFDKINLEKFLKFLKTHDNKDESVVGYSAIFDELKKRNKLDGNVLLVTLAFDFKNSLRGDLSSEANAAANLLRDALPASVRNLAFATKVCIKSDHFSEYLYAASDAFNHYSGSRRTVFTWTVIHQKVKYTDWAVEPYKGVYHIKNVQRNEYMFSPNFFYNFNDELRRTFTWTPGGTDGDNEKFEWTFVPYKDSVYIKNAYYNEYLIPSLEKIDDKRRYTVTKEDYENYVSRWSIEDCS